jgi:zinc protease
LDRTKNELLREIEQYYKEKDKTESESYAGEYQRNFLEDEPIPGIQYEYELSQVLIPGITLDEINNMVNTLMTEKNRVVMIDAPEQEVSVIPDENQLIAIFAKMDEQEVEAYVDEVSDKPLVGEISQTSKIKKEKIKPGTGLIELRFQGFSTGGTSLLNDADYLSGNSAADVISLSGAGEFELNDLNKKLTGKVVTVFPYINDLTEGLIGDASPEDMETMFQLIYLYMTAPRKDTVAFRSYQVRMKGYIKNRSADPEAAFSDTLMVTLAKYNPRQKPWSTEMLDQLNYNVLYDFYRERFANARDFTFIFVGNFTPEEIKPLVTKYLGGLPSINRKETWKDNGLNYPEGIIKKTVMKGIEPRAIVSMNFTGMAKWSRENNYILQSLESVLDIKLREVIREDMSGTYGVSVSSVLNLYPIQNYKVTISFGCDPDRTEELTNSVFQVIDSLKTFGSKDIYITKVRETQLRSYETNLKGNTFWLRALQSYYFRGQNPDLILKYPELVGTLTSGSIQKAASQYLNKNNYVQVILLPGGEIKM